MKRLGIYFWFCVLSAFAQEPNFQEVYFPQIMDAENWLMEDNNLYARRSYEKAFAAVPDSHLKDYFNAAVCSTYLGDAKKTYTFLKGVASKGLSLDFIKDEVAFRAILKDPSWRDFELEYLQIRRQSEESQNHEFKKILNILDARARWFREKNAQTFADTIALIDADNALILDSLMSEYGFPGESEIGIGYGGYPVIEPSFFEIIKTQTPDVQVVNFSNRILEGLRKGKITPHLAAHLLRHINEEDTYFMRNLFMVKTDEPFEMKYGNLVNEWVYVDLMEEDELAFNDLRLGFGMEKLTDYRKKILFSLQDHRFLLPYKIFANIWFVKDPETADTFLENTIKANGL